jgi:phage/plasmid primase, P4 family, C-terminal domain
MNNEDLNLELESRFYNSKSINRKINLNEIKNYILEKYILIYVEELYLHTGVYYKRLSEHDFIVWINRILSPNINDNLTTESKRKIYELLKFEPKIQCNIENIDNSDKINCLGVDIIQFDCMNGKIYHRNRVKEDIFFNYINAKYIEGYSLNGSNFYKYLNAITNGDLELKKLIQQVLGYIISGFNNAKKAFFLYGKSNSGKSVFLNIITNLCGEENISHVELQNLHKETYVAELFGKSVNICSELPDRGIKDTGIFKSLVSETDKVLARRLYGHPFSFYNKAKLVFATNNLPQIEQIYSDNKAFFNRLIIIPFNYEINEKFQDKSLPYKLSKERDLIFSWAFDGLRDYIRNGFVFSECYESSKVLTEYKKNSNIVSCFIEEKCVFGEQLYIHMDKLYYEFEKYCEETMLEQPTNKDIKYLKEFLKIQKGVKYKRLNRPEGNKYGFQGVSLK